MTWGAERAHAGVPDPPASADRPLRPGRRSGRCGSARRADALGYGRAGQCRWRAVGVMAVGSMREELLPADTEARLVGFTELIATAVANAQARMELRGFAEEQAAPRRGADPVARGGPPARG